jgi:hypothetical protein
MFGPHIRSGSTGPSAKRFRGNGVGSSDINVVEQPCRWLNFPSWPYHASKDIKFSSLICEISVRDKPILVRQDIIVGQNQQIARAMRKTNVEGLVLAPMLTA